MPEYYSELDREKTEMLGELRKMPVELKPLSEEEIQNRIDLLRSKTKTAKDRAMQRNIRNS